MNWDLWVAQGYLVDEISRKGWLDCCMRCGQEATADCWIVKWNITNWWVRSLAGRIKRDWLLSWDPGCDENGHISGRHSWMIGWGVYRWGLVKNSEQLYELLTCRAELQVGTLLLLTSMSSCEQRGIHNEGMLPAPVQYLNIGHHVHCGWQHACVYICMWQQCHPVYIY